MGRRFTAGAEIYVNSGEQQNAPEGDSTGANITRDTAIKRSGAASWKVVNNSSAHYITWNLAGISFHVAARVYIYVTSLPAASMPIFGILNVTATVGNYVRLTSGGLLQLWADDNTTDQQEGSSSAAISLNTWYRLELESFNNDPGTDPCEFRLDGETIASSDRSLSTSGLDRVFIGCLPNITAPSSGTVYFDDVAINDGNDDGGGQQNSWPGEGKVVFLKPTSDSQRGSWTGGAGGTTNLWDAVDNTPPVGTATETNTTQIESVDASGNNATDEYRAALQTYESQDISLITLIQPVINHGEDAATGTPAGSFGMQANPSGSYDTFNFGDNLGALGTWPTNWRWKRGAVIYDPSPTLSSSPILAVRKTDAGTAVASVDCLGLFVDFIGAIPVSDSDTGTGTDTAVVAITVSDTGTGADTGLPRRVVPDTGAGTEAHTLVITTADTGAGTDTATPNYALDDTGVGTDTATISIALSDTGTGTDTGLVSLTASETGTGTDEISALSREVPDTGSGTEAHTLVVTTADTGVGTDVISAFTRAVPDSGTGTDNALIAIAASDVGTGTENSVVGVYGTDTGSGTENQIVSQTVSDSGTSTEIVALAITVADTGVGVDEISTFVRQLFDYGGATETTTITITVADSGAGTENQRVSLAATDTGTGSETHALVITAADSGAGTEVSSIAIALSDTGTGTDTGIVTVPATVTDSATAIEFVTLAVALTGLETLTGADTGTLAAAQTVDEAGTGSESQIISQILVDSGTATENASISISLVDTGSGSEILNPLREISDSGIGTEAQVVAFLLVDAGISTDLISAFTREVPDSGAGTDTATAVIYAAEIGAGVDTATLVVVLSVADTAFGSDSAILFSGTSFVIVDSGVGSESIGGMKYELQDGGAGAETFNINRALQDSGTSTENASAGSIVAGTDSGTATENTLLTITATDSGTSDEFTTSIASLIVFDTGGSTFESGGFMVERFGYDEGYGSDMGFNTPPDIDFSESVLLSANGSKKSSLVTVISPRELSQVP